MLPQFLSILLVIRILANIENKPIVAPKILGVDDWSIKKGKTYGTILVDMDRIAEAKATTH